MTMMTTFTPDCLEHGLPENLCPMCGTLESPRPIERAQVSSFVPVQPIGSETVLHTLPDMRERYDEIHDYLRQATAYLAVHTMLDLMLATVGSLPLSEVDGTALVWMLFVAPPSSGKTATLNNLKGSPYVIKINRLTAASFYSGYVQKDGNVPPHKGLLEELKGKCLAFPDLTTTVSERSDKVADIFGILRSAFDGEFARRVGTMALGHQESRFNVIGCTTSAEYQSHQRLLSSTGDRFLYFRLREPLEVERQAQKELKRESRGEAKAINAQLQSLCAAHIEAIQAHAQKFPGDWLFETVEGAHTISGLARLATVGRGVIDHRHDERQIETDDRCEDQLLTLGRALAISRGETTVTSEVLTVLRQVAWSTIPPQRARALACFHVHPDGVTARMCSVLTGKAESTMHDALKDLVRLGVLREERPKHITKTNPIWYRIDKNFSQAIMG